MVGDTGIEPVTPTMSTWCSPTELIALIFINILHFKTNKNKNLKYALKNMRIVTIIKIMKNIYIATIFLCVILFHKVAFSETLNLYSARQEVLMRDLIKFFEKEENIKVNLISAKANQLIEKIEMEGEYTKADILLTVDIARLLEAKNRNLFMSVKNKILDNNIPEQYRDKDNKWFGLSLRSRLLVYNKDRVYKDELKGYMGLMEDKWKSRILVRSSNNVYNQSLVSAMISNYGRDATKKFLINFKNNFARNPSGGDRDQIRAVVAGEGDLALVNSYYYIKMKKNDHENKLKNLRVHFPSDDKMKTHINISGAGIIKFSKNYDNAIKFLEFLVSDEAQKIYAEINFEYPVRNNIKLNKFMSNYSIPEKDSLNLNQIASFNKEALFMMGESGWK